MGRSGKRKSRRDAKAGRAARHHAGHGAGEGDTPIPGRYQVSSGEAEIRRDPDRRDAWLLSIDGVPQSHVDLGDPTYLAFEYVSRIGTAIDCLAPEAQPLDAIHVGGGACTLGRYIARTRPGSRQLVFEPDGKLVELVRRQLELRAVPWLKTHVTDGRSGLAKRPDDRADLVVVDAFEGPALPVPLVTGECVHEVARVLRPAGTYILNVADGPGLLFARRVAATAREVFASVAVLAEPGVLRGRHFGNLILLASSGDLPGPQLQRRVAGAAFPARCLEGPELDSFCAHAQPLTDESPQPAPQPPAGIFG